MRRYRLAVSWLFLVVVLGSLSPWAAGAVDGIDLVMVIDNSGSMAQNDPDGRRIEALQLFGQLLRPQDRLSIVLFDSTARLAKSLDEEAAISSVTAAITSQGEQSNIAAGLELAMDHLKEQGSVEHQPRIVLITDGEVVTGSQAESDLAKLRLQYESVKALTQYGIVVDAVGVGNQPDQELLSKISETTAGQMIIAPGPNEFVSVLQELATQLTDRHPITAVRQVGQHGSYQFSVDREMQELTVVVRPGSPGTMVVEPNGTAHPYNPEDSSWVSTPNASIFHWKNPVAGDWQIESAEALQVSPLYSSPLRLAVKAWRTADQQVQLRVWFERAGQPINDEQLYQESASLVQMLPQVTSPITKLQMQKADETNQHPYFAANMPLDRAQHYTAVIEVMGPQARKATLSFSPSVLPALSQPASASPAAPAGWLAPGRLLLMAVLLLAAGLAAGLVMRIVQGPPTYMALEDASGTSRIVLRGQKQDLANGVVLRRHKQGHDDLLVIQAREAGRLRRGEQELFVAELRNQERVTIDDMDYITIIQDSRGGGSHDHE